MRARRSDAGGECEPKGGNDVRYASRWLAVAGATVSNATNQGTSDPFCLAVSHPALLAGTPYQILVPQGLTASDGSTLAAAITSRFRTASP